jgi:RNA polymerase sigma-70 factor (ECF subfamily)
MAPAPRPHEPGPKDRDPTPPPRPKRPFRSVPAADESPEDSRSGGPATGGAGVEVDQGALHADDLALCRRMLAGDRASGDTFVALHLDGVYRFLLYRVGRDVALAEDLAQETLVTGIERLATYDGRASLHAWLCGIAKNHLRGGVRKRRPTSIEDLLASSDSDIDALLARIEHEPLPDEVLERAETAELVGATLSSLPPNYRTALLEKYVDGRTVPETATRTGRNVKAVESTLHRARRAFSDVFTLLARRRGGFD